MNKPHESKILHFKNWFNYNSILEFGIRIHIVLYNLEPLGVILLAVSLLSSMLFLMSTLLHFFIHKRRFMYTISCHWISNISYINLKVSLFRSKQCQISQSCIFWIWRVQKWKIKFRRKIKYLSLCWGCGIRLSEPAYKTGSILQYCILLD